MQGIRFAGGLFPFVPIIVGAALKFALIDVVGADPLTHFVEIYLRPAWIEFIVVAYVTGLAAIVSKGELELSDTWIYFAFPAACLVVCLFLVFGLPKTGIEGNLWQVYIPLAITALSLAVSGGRVGN